MRPRPRAGLAPVLAPVLAILAASACSAAPAAPVAEPRPVAVERAGGDPAAFNVVAVAAPEELVLDGDLAEWGALPPPKPSAPVGAQMRAEAESQLANHKTPAHPGGANPEDAPSRLAVAFAKGALVVAADLGPAASKGFWIAIGGWVPSVPLLGQSGGRSGFIGLQCEFQVECGEAGFGDGSACMVGQKPNPPEVVEPCKRLLAHHEALVAEHDARFSVAFRVEPGGVRAVLRGGATKPVAGAAVAWKLTEKGAAAEVSLPVVALPRFGEAPLPTLRVFASAALAKASPDLPAADWIGVDLPAPVTFEPLGALRAKVFEDQATYDERFANPSAAVYQQPKGKSYHPSDPLHFECMEGTGANGDFSIGVHSLYVKKASLGDLEVGLADACGGGTRLAVLKSTKLAAVIDLRGKLEGPIVRGNEIHALASSDGYDPGWSGFAIGPDGQRRDVVEKIKLAADEPDPREPDAYWHDVTTFASKDLDSFGWRGEKGKAGVEVTWRWDEGKRMYLARERKVPLKPKPKRRRRR